MKKGVLAMVLVLGCVSLAGAAQMVFDYGEQNLLLRLPDGTGRPDVLSYDTGSLGSAWYSCYSNIGVMMPTRYSAARAAIKWDLSGLDVPAGMTVQVNEARMRIAVKTNPSWYAPVDILYATEAWEYGDTNWDSRDVSASTAWTTPGGAYSGGAAQLHSNGNWTTHDVVLDNSVVASWFNAENLGVIVKGPEPGDERAGGGIVSETDDLRALILRPDCPGVDTSWDKSGTYASRPVLLVDYSIVPEPATIGLLVMGLAGIIRRRK